MISSIGWPGAFGLVRAPQPFTWPQAPFLSRLRTKSETARRESRPGAADNAGVRRQGSVQPVVSPSPGEEESQCHDTKGEQVCL